MEELENLRLVRCGSPADLEQFPDFLDLTIINLKENGNCGELGNDSLYLRLQKKLSEIMLTQYHRWIYEKRRQPFKITLREWIIMESEYQAGARETVFGLKESNKGSGWRRYHAHTTFGCCKIFGKRRRV